MTDHGGPETRPCMGMRESDSCVVRLRIRKTWCVTCENFIATVTECKMLTTEGVTDFGDLTVCPGCGLMLMTPARGRSSEA